MGTPPAADRTSVRLRDGDREVEVHGSAPFCRQILDEIPALLARLTADPVTAPAIALPAPSRRAEAATPPHDDPAAASGAAITPAAVGRAEAAPAAELRSRAGTDHPAAARAGVPNGHRAPRHPSASLEEKVLAVVRRSQRPVGVAEIRAHLGDDVSGQAVRRVLERAQGVVSVGGRPAAYRAR